MSSQPKKKAVPVIVEKGKPPSVIISLKEYEELLERAQDFEDLEYIRKLTKRRLKSRPFEEFMAEHFPGV